MRKFILLISIFSCFQAHADFINWKVGPVDGRLQTIGNLVLEDAQAVLYCQYCNISTCAGGPSKETALSTSLTSQGGGEYELSIAGGRHMSGYPLKNLSGCGYYLTLTGYDRQSGTRVKGEIALAASDRHDENPVWDNNALADELSETLTSQPLQLEIQTRGLAKPEIYPVKRN